MCRWDNGETFFYKGGDQIRNAKNLVVGPCFYDLSWIPEENPFPVEHHAARHSAVVKTFHGVCRVFIRQLTGSILGDRRRIIRMKTFDTLAMLTHFEITMAAAAKTPENIRQHQYHLDEHGMPNWIVNDDDESTSDDCMGSSDESETFEMMRESVGENGARDVA